MAEGADQPTVALTRGLLERLEELAVDAQPTEACGLLVGECRAWHHYRVDRLEVTENLASDPERYFEVDARVHLRLQRELRASGLGVIGIWHSHPNGLEEPSESDRQRAAYPGWLWLITAPKGFTTAWRDDGELFHPVALLVD